MAAYVLADPQVRVTARWISWLREASIEMRVTGVAGTAANKERSLCLLRLATPLPRALLS
jgi:hypothetical protein